MGFTLLDRPNPNGPHYYPTRRQRLLAIVVHITAGLEDLDGVDDHSAEQTAAYAANTDRDVSWHSGSDTDSWVDLLPASYTAWHVVNYNSCTYGHELSKAHTDWSVMPEFWVAATLTRSAPGLAAVAAAYGIPLRKATRAELDHAIATGGPPVGFISHAELQPEDRTDPGMVRGRDTFPWGRLFTLMTDSQGDLMLSSFIVQTRGGRDVHVADISTMGSRRRQLSPAELAMTGLEGAEITQVDAADLAQIRVGSIADVIATAVHNAQVPVDLPADQPLSRTGFEPHHRVVAAINAQTRRPEVQS